MSLRGRCAAVHLLEGEGVFVAAVQGGAVGDDHHQAGSGHAPGQAVGGRLEALRQPVVAVVAPAGGVHALHPHLQPGPVVCERHAGGGGVELELGEPLLRRLLGLHLLAFVRHRRGRDGVLADALERDHPHLHRRALGELRHELHHLGAGAAGAASAELAHQRSHARLHRLRLLHQERHVHLPSAAGRGPFTGHGHGGAVHLRRLLPEVLGQLLAHYHRHSRGRARLHREGVRDFEVTRGAEEGLVIARLQIVFVPRRGPVPIFHGGPVVPHQFRLALLDLFVGFGGDGVELELEDGGELDQHVGGAKHVDLAVLRALPLAEPLAHRQV
mmetsp:Transcript_2097/g.3575  ORF Transcript_2097/g.3575 Transcript_2097/m.3575 type:complete len:329 (-) Transcript_2097:1000-1986(-)